MRSAHEPFLVELAQWIARAQQYSTNHPACAVHAERAHRALTASLALEAPLVFAVLKDRVLHGETPLTHPAIANRLAPYLHERAILGLRFSPGVQVAELAVLVEILSLTVSVTYEQGGIGAISRSRGLTRIQIDELTHDISTEERRVHEKKTRLRVFVGEALRSLLAQRSLEGLGAFAPDVILELLEHPDVAVAILEEDPLGVVDAFAGLCLMVQEEERRSGTPLRDRLKGVLRALSAKSLDRVLVGFGSLVGEFRAAVKWLFDGLDEHEVADLAFASLRAHPRDVDVVFHALALAVPHDGHRMASMRRASRRLYDLPAEDEEAMALVVAVARQPLEHDSYGRERAALAPHAMRALAMRRTFPPDVTAVQRDETAPTAFEGRRTMIELVTMAARTRRFEQFCARLPASVVQLARAGSTESVIGVMRGLLSVTRAEYKDLARATLGEVMTPEVAEQLLVDLDAASATVEGAALEDVTATVRLVAAIRPEVVLERLEASESRKMRRVVLDALANIGPVLLPHVRSKLGSSSWFVVRNAVVLVPYASGTPADLAQAARHPNEKVRTEVVRALRTMPIDSTAMEIVVGLVGDPIPEIRRAALPMIRGDQLSPAAVARLAELAVDEKIPEELRVRLVGELGRSPLDQAAAALFALLQPRGLIELSSLRDVVAVALYRSPARVAQAYFAEGLKSTAYRVRKACERAAAGGGA